VITFEVNVDGVRRKLSLLAESAKDLNAPLKSYGSNYLRNKVQQRFDEEGPGWADRSDATKAKLAQGRSTSRAEAYLGRKLARETRRAKRKLDTLSTEHGWDREARRQAARSSSGKSSKSMAAIIRSRMASVSRRQAVEKVFEAIVSGATIEGKSAERIAGKLKERLGRAEKKGGGPVLGKIAQSFKLTVSKGTLTYGSTIPWAGVQNEGGPVGNGATLPPRPFAYLTERDLDILVDMLQAHLGLTVNVE